MSMGPFGHKNPEPDYRQCEVCKKIKKKLFAVKPLAGDNFFDKLVGAKTVMACEDCIEKQNREIK